MTDTSIHFTLEPQDNDRLARLCGALHGNIRQIEKGLQVRILAQGHSFHIDGEQMSAKHAEQIIKKLYQLTEHSQTINAETIQLEMTTATTVTATEPDHNKAATNTVLTIRHKTIKGRSPAQQRYLTAIAQHTISFGIGPSGTGKTFLAVASAVAALEQEMVDKIILVRPAVEAGESLGFLPGDLAQKIDPYLQPLYDSLARLLGNERLQYLIDKQKIEIAPLAYMRGRTLNDAFVILDEGQNTTEEQMKMFLTRIGFGTKAVVTGDITQTDLPRNKESGLKQAIRLLNNIEGIGFNFLTAQDIVRHPIVQEIVNAYENQSIC